MRSIYLAWRYYQTNKATFSEADDVAMSIFGFMAVVELAGCAAGAYLAWLLLA